MGTSASSGGPGGGVPMVPPGVPPINPFPDAPSSAPDNNPQQVIQPQQSPIIAPPRRFASARTSLGRYARSSSRNDLAAGLGHYTRSGLGGASRAAQRMGNTVKTAGALYSILDNLRTNRPIEIGIESSQLVGRSAREVGDYIINAICPPDGTQDAEAGRDAIAQAISDLIEQFPQVDLTTITVEQIDLVTERYVAYDICHRIELDVGNAIFKKSADCATAVRHLEDMKQYVREKVAACFRARANNGQRLTRADAERVAATVIQDTFRIFEEYFQ